MSNRKNHSDIIALDAIDRASLPPDGGPVYNRLIFEQSPYLLQHATNPVDWHPWGDDAFSRAKAEDKPVFLSIGYSTCHWCHVMAAESFADPAVAAVLSRHVIAVKVDREERPDIDQQYMIACQLMTGSGGWPLTLLLDHERRPFFAATYLPPYTRHGRPGLVELLEKVDDLWTNQREKLLDSCQQVTKVLISLSQQSSMPSCLDDRPLQQALAAWRKTYDKRSAGFGSAPKFPTPHVLSLLWRLADRIRSTDAAGMAAATLKAIRHGGIYDQIGFGLHRYAVDDNWAVPHFEKMLYDQALFIHAALDGYQASGNKEFADHARDTINYLLRDLMSDEGAFCCGEDADSAGEEGLYYLWTPDQVHATLPADQAELVCLAYGITAAGNFEGRCVPFRARDESALAQRFGMSEDEVAISLEQARQGLLIARATRVRPLRDDKLLAGWNALTAGALARAGALLEEPKWVATAGHAIDFLLGTLVDKQGRLRRSWRRRLSDIPAFAEDYVQLVWGLTELFIASQDPLRLEQALHWCDTTQQLFGDGSGDLWECGTDAEAVFTRGRNTTDGAIPSAGSIHALSLLRIADLTGVSSLREAGELLLRRRLGNMGRQPEAHAQLLIALDYALGPTLQIVITQGATGHVDAFLSEVRKRFLPRSTCIVTGGQRNSLAAFAPLSAHYQSGARTQAYLCSGQTCQTSATSPVELGLQLDAFLQRLTPAPPP